MLPSEKLAIAAHLHVLLRRKTGRVTDTEWMARNAEYAAEIVRFARRSAQEDGHMELVEWADKLEQAVVGGAPAGMLVRGPSQAARPGGVGLLAALVPKVDGANEVDAPRYVRGLR